MDMKEVRFSESMDYMGITCKKLTTSLAVSNKSTNKKQKESFAITETTNQDFRKLLKKN